MRSRTDDRLLLSFGLLLSYVPPDIENRDRANDKAATGSATGAAGSMPTHGSGSMPATDMNSCYQVSPPLTSQGDRTDG